ncbi:MAG TPA: hypothetical protein VH374_03060 [Polyangia bacterium]|nr:hypothetical protein [Polyangia bacterium]
MSAPGYQPEEQSVVPGKDLIVQLGMQKEKEAVALPAPPAHRPGHHGGEGRGSGKAKSDKNIVTDLYTPPGRVPVDARRDRG